jgi:hypothetical protein
MPENESPKTSVNPGYILGQLSRAISAAIQHPDPSVQQRAIERTKRWEQVFQGMLSGTVSFGMRAPVQDVPEWVTLEVVRGGFATGNLVAGGPLQAFELDLLRHLNREPDNTARAALNIYYLGDLGQRDLCAMLETGCYRINVPEEGALLVVAWLLSQEMAEKAQQLIDLITPFFDRLRFYPVPDMSPMVPSPTVHRHSVAQTITVLQGRRQQAQIEQMIEALRVWQPLYDRAVSLFLETIEDDHPCRKYGDDWRNRAQALLDEYSRLRKVHTLCRKPDRPKENFARLRGFLKQCIDNPAQVSERDRGMIRHILRCYATRHGLPDSEHFAQRRAEQARIANLPTHDEFTRVLIARLQQFPEDNGIGNIESVAVPIADIESAQSGLPTGLSIPDYLVLKARRCWDAPIEQLVENGVIPSGDVLAQVLPQITSQVRAAGIRDRDLRRLYGAIYSAFRRRRSLLLLNLERQVRFEDLPWIDVLNSLRQDDLDARDEAHQVLEQVTTIAIVSFPQAILPNKLLQELRTLANGAGLTIPMVDELAADIFMGAFTEKYLGAAQVAAKMLRGSVYERYYGLNYERVMNLDDIQETHGAKTSPGFAALCEELAQVQKEEGRSVSRNGKIIEQSQILTTQNLASLFAALNLRSALSVRLRELSEGCFLWISKRQVSNSWKANLRMVKNSAYAWRQMLFFVSLMDLEMMSSFIQWMRSEVKKQNSAFAQRLDPVLSGLELIANGGSFDRQGTGGASAEARRFVGWTTGRHWLLDSEKKETNL